MSRFEIFKSMKAGVVSPFRIIETNETFDGPRSRIMDGCFKSWREAADHIRPVDATIHASHELTIYYADGSTILHREEFYGSDIEAQKQLTTIWNDKTPADGTGFKATARRYGNPKPFNTIG
jgi:hypothetical protein